MHHMHEHSCYEIYFLVSGGRRYLMRDTVYEVDPGDLMLIPQNQLHRTVSSARTDYNRYVVYFSEKEAERLTGLIGEQNFESLIHSGCLRFPAPIAAMLRGDLEQLSRLEETASPYNEALSVHLFQGIMLKALRHGIKKERLEGKSADKVQFIANYISSHYQEEITLASAAEMAGFEKTYFSKLFRTITGFGFQDYLLQTRILAAEPLLKNPKLSINEIAEACGFSSGNYFGDVFRRYRGISPSEYRKKSFE